MKAAKVVAVALIGLVAWGALRSPTNNLAPPAEPARSEPVALSAQVLSVTCDPNSGRTRADVTIRNTSPVAIRFPKAHVRFGVVMHDSYLSPDSVPPSSLASGRVYSPERNVVSTCELVAIQDADGNPVSLSR